MDVPFWCMVSLEWSWKSWERLLRIENFSGFYVQVGCPDIPVFGFSLPTYYEVTQYFSCLLVTYSMSEIAWLFRSNVLSDDGKRQSNIFMILKSKMSLKILVTDDAWYLPYTIFLNMKTWYWCAEGRPDRTGLRLSNELAKLDVPVKLLIDSAVAYSMDEVDMVFVGADGVVESGGIINMMGTYQIALVAKSMNKPVYVAAESYKVHNISICQLSICHFQLWTYLCIPYLPLRFLLFEKIQTVLVFFSVMLPIHTASTLFTETFEITWYY